MKIRAYTKGDEKEIMELDARELPSRWNPRTLENWYWKYTERNPAGHAFVWVAEHQDHLVGHFAAVPYRLKLFDEVVTASHTIGALVDKKFQNRGLLKFVGEKLMEDLEKNNIPYTWGFPNRLAHKFENVILKYNDLVNFDLWKIEKAALKKSPPHPGIRRVIEFDDVFNELWDTCSPDYEIAVVRNKIYLNWRYLQRPDWKYYPFALYDGEALKGYVVLKLYKEEETLRGHIIDIFSRRDDEHTLAGLIDHSLNFFIDEGVDEITVLIWGNPLVEILFIDRGFFKELIDRPLILRINLDHKYKDKIQDNSHWYFTMGDSTEIF
jgi:hypothetical protein